MNHRTFFACSLFAMFLSAAPGDEPLIATSKQVAEWITQLESEKYSEREAATTKLAGAGKVTIAALEVAMKSGKAETGIRGMTVLEQLAGSKDAPTSTAAKDALRRLGVDEDKIASLSNEPKQQAGVATAVLQVGGGQGGVIQIGGGGALQVVPGQVIQLGQGQATISVSVTTAVAAKGDSVSVTTVNGVRTITVKEKERTVEIKEQQGDALELLITKTAGGKTKTEKIEAKNADDLKKRHPKLYALYRKHAGK
ncbi:MAG: hypothetical protein QF473_05380 [Planctomycetota bacterium]|jgi:hypothetical protein|nr:hypothetical protein [Planctomycetota bacterium]